MNRYFHITFLTFVAILLLSTCKGEKGDPGSSCSVSRQGTTSTITCDDGTTAVVNDGATGPTGPSGEPGISCTVEPVVGGTRLACSDGTSNTIWNGTTVEHLPICPHDPGGVFVEYAIRVEQEVFAVYAKGQAIGYTKLEPLKVYNTTDGRKAAFMVTLAGQIECL